MRTLKKEYLLHIMLLPGVIVTLIYAYGPMAGLVMAFQAKGASLMDAQQRAYAALDGTLQKQAAMLAYNDSWLFILLSFLCVIPAVFLLRRNRGGAAAAVDAH